MLTRSRPTSPEITLEVHPPERRRRPAAVAACGCCCCCCCCLHSLAGLVAAATASKSRSENETRAISSYWILFAAGSALTMLGFWLASGPALEGVIGGIVMLLLLIPAVQLGAAAIAAIIAASSAGSISLGKVGSLALRGFLGALLGAGIMLIAFLIFF